MVTFSTSNHQSSSFDFQLARLAALVSDMEAIGRGVSPKELAGVEAPLLDRWTLGYRPIQCLLGHSTGHPLLPGEDRTICTSDLWLISEGYEWARTLSRWYRLGRPTGQERFQS